MGVLAHSLGGEAIAHVDHATASEPFVSLDVCGPRHIAGMRALSFLQGPAPCGTVPPPPTRHAPVVAFEEPTSFLNHNDFRALPPGKGFGPGNNSTCATCACEAAVTKKESHVKIICPNVPHHSWHQGAGLRRVAGAGLMGSFLVGAGLGGFGGVKLRERTKRRLLERQQEAADEAEAARRAGVTGGAVSASSVGQDGGLGDMGSEDSGSGGSGSQNS
eukprot:gnl/TRDRNA2_/TRDRNA2_190411_c0_seq1.p1 gnl/TRDRNA2_/TRDRNA2_190411_c0~~gnl/TRDRNA2_/TRDRNA2_190411_c0_seq1.p1  ORF type:complete len:218 (+),score=25.62 gnl/TRDRNA2_/TRDRNA2_190411_c0_seq1:50-703(+)